MAFDGLFTRAITHEIANSLQTGRISKIYQPSKYEVLLHIRANGKNQKLLISAHPTYARMHLTNQSYDSPALPPMFCMLLRKHLEGGFIEKIEQIDLERIIQITVRSRNEIGDESLKTLVIEIMGRHSNIILVDAKTNIILDSLKHVSLAVNRHRTVYAGAEYVAPPAQHKINPLQIETQDEFIRPLDFLAGNMDKQLVGAFMGISPLFAKEVVKKAVMVNEHALSEAFFTLQKPMQAHQYEPTMITANGKEFFYLFPLTHLKGHNKTFLSVSELLDRFFFGKAERDRVKQQAHDLERFMHNEKAKNEKKLIKLQKTLQDAGKADKYQLFGELLTANMYALKKGDKEIEVVNYYDENGGTVKITLDPLKTPSENAQRYFQKYQKAKNSVAIVKEQIEKTNEEILYFDSLLQQMEAASSKDIEEIREELAEEGYMRNRKSKNTKKKTSKPILDKYISTDGTEILVGKNNKQNDYLTTKFARRDEIWLHTKDIPGSHVVIRSLEPTEETLLEAAKLAAYYSKAKDSSSVPVDFTKIRHVKKPSGAKLGFVTYDNQQTLYVTPDADTVMKLKA
ncbi:MULTISPECIES: Rqc2 family fibronectin-binding protein [Bacillus]|uniref:Rqc2 family fibronectin-binding protein n=1 Tax=Bacillus TaxID=1386 RepID=UPI0001A1343B|nr:NFACT RNA binding domain-containing protein [Bacillus pseudomycoides]AIK39156.1 fibronectin-binding A family protein [Bacillus pseudomycoides]AJI19442.1 fibronectin-binding A family protein [Bacillus pseudomycoides]EEM15873.1 Fibronectin-binding A-like protein [Bacillus pseudomycoides DSM 12442]MED1597702.1 NFACT RNA binding domain-containing protein [Bacillus pseudomycoides]MED4711605.1 NFACT RNA binding domain-containing protein [Bacillus pseudomycoides]